MTYLTCPCCYREMNPVCGNPDCPCLTDIPANELPMVNLPGDGEACPYCGFSAHIDFWSWRKMEEYQLLPSREFLQRLGISIHGRS